MHAKKERDVARSAKYLAEQSLVKVDLKKNEPAQIVAHLEKDK